MNWIRRTAIAMMTLIGLVGTAAADAPGGGTDYGHHMWHDGWGGMAFGPFTMAVSLLVVALIVFLAVWLFGFGGRSSPSHSDRQALDVLKERFARGEIDQDEFQERRRVLGG